MKTLVDSIELRAKRIRAYKAGKYTFEPPSVYCGNWEAQDWHNHVQFQDKKISGFLPYNKLMHQQAAAIA